MLGHGTTITFSSGYCGSVQRINRTGLTRAAVPTTHFGTSGGKTFVPSDTYDPGELLVEAQRDASDAVPITGAAETVTLTFPGSLTEAFSGFLVDHEMIAEDEETVMETLRIKASGSVTWGP